MTGPIIVKTIERVPAQVIADLRGAGVATAHEASGRIGLLAPSIRPIQQDVAIAGSAVTVECHPGDNMMIHAAVEVISPGDVLVVSTTGESTDGMFGDLLATSLASRDCAGLVISAGVRDTAELRTMGFPVWARAVHAQGTVKATPGSVNVPIRFGDQRIEPGDVVVADDDGVMIVPSDRAASVAESARQRVATEEATRARLLAGELGLDLYGLRERLQELGVRWVDRAEDA